MAERKKRTWFPSDVHNEATRWITN